MLFDVIRRGGSAEWCVTVDGKYVVGFAGPDARERAERQKEELQELLSQPAPEDGAAAIPTAAATPDELDAPELKSLR